MFEPGERWEYSLCHDVLAALEVCPKTILYKLGSEYESGGAGCVSTVDDYIKFLEGLRTGKLLETETIELMTTNYLTEEQRESYWVKEYGYGLGVRCSMGDDDITDFGWGGAAGSYLFIDPKNEITAFYAQHVLNSPFQDLRAQIRPIIQEVLNESNDF